jgi:Ser/Thr protein kinase RdoA (MazF antagonist)
VYPFIAGMCLEHADAAALAEVAQALARFHQVAAAYPAAQTLPPVSQYSTVGVARQSDRMEDPELLAEVYLCLEREAGAGEFGAALAVARRWLARLGTEFDRSVYTALPHTVTHGDFTLANLLLDDAGRAKGIFDLDWARWAPRIRDVADGMLFIAGSRRTPLRAGDIWSLAEAPDLSVERCAAWLRAYQRVAPLSGAETKAIPLAAAARWLSVRAEGTAKVAATARLQFCFGNLVGPLAWLEQQWATVAAQVGGPP